MKKMRPTNKQIYIAGFIVFVACALLAYMVNAFTYTFNGAVMQARVKSIEQFAEIVDGDLPVSSILVYDKPVNHHRYKTGNYHAVGSVRPSQKIDVIGISGDWAKIQFGKTEAWLQTLFIDMKFEQ